MSKDAKDNQENIEEEDKNQLDQDVNEILEEIDDTSIENGEEPKKIDSSEVVEENVHEEEHLASQITNETISSENIKVKKKRRKKKKKIKVGSGLVLTTFILCFSVVLSIFILTVMQDFFGINKGDDLIIVDIPKGSTVDEISELLVENELISYPKIFKAYSKLLGKEAEYIAGEHVIHYKAGYEGIINELTSNALDKRVYVDVMFQEGITLLQAAKKLEEAEVCNASDFIYTFNSIDLGYDFQKQIKASSLEFYKMEGFLFPDTYTFYVDEDVEIVCNKILQNFDKKLTKKHYDRMEELNMTLEQTITLASIIQGEAGEVNQMKKVASVFWNRLNDKATFPLLQSDPTRKYVRETIKPNIAIQSETMNNAYDTYIGVGLPPGAINNPGIDAIEAVLYPADTEYYFFCSNLETREFYYATTLEEHEANLKTAGLA